MGKLRRTKRAISNASELSRVYFEGRHEPLEHFACMQASVEDSLLDRPRSVSTSFHTNVMVNTLTSNEGAS